MQLQVGSFEVLDLHDSAMSGWAVQIGAASGASELEWFDSGFTRLRLQQSQILSVGFSVGAGLQPDTCVCQQFKNVQFS